MLGRLLNLRITVAESYSVDSDCYFSFEHAASIKNRISSLGPQTWNLGCGGCCYFHCLAPIARMTVNEVVLSCSINESQWPQGGRWCWRALLLYSVYCVCTWTAILKSPSHISWSEVRLLPLQDAIDTRKWLNAWFLCLLGCLLGAPLHLIIAHGHSTPRYTTCSNWSKVGRCEKMYQQNEDRYVSRSAHS